MAFGKIGKSKRGAKGRAKKGKQRHKAREQEDLVDKNWRLTERVAFLELELRNTIFVKEQFKSSLDALQKETEQCKSDLEESEKSRQDMAKYLYTSEQKHEEMLLKFYTDFNSLKRTADEEKRAYQEQALQEQEELNRKLEFQEFNIGVMQQELHKFKHYDRERLVIHQQLDELRETVLDVTKDHQDVIDRLERRFMREKKRLEDSAEKRLKVIAREAHAQAICNLSKKSLRIFNENIQLMAAVRGIMDNNIYLKSRMEKALMHALRAEYGLESRKMVLSQLMDKYHKMVSISKHLEAENGDFRAKLVVQSERFAREREMLLLRLAHGGNATSRQLRSLEASLFEKDAELRRVATMARSILEQRTDVEAFLTSAIQYVKQQLRGGSRALVERTPPNHASDKNTDIDWDKMSWKKRERILRHLFVQINSVKSDRPKRREVKRNRPPLCDMWHLTAAAPCVRSEAATQTDLEGEVTLSLVPVDEDTAESYTDRESLEAHTSDSHTFVAALLAECLDF